MGPCRRRDTPVEVPPPGVGTHDRDRRSSGRRDLPGTVCASFPAVFSRRPFWRRGMKEVRGGGCVNAMGTGGAAGSPRQPRRRPDRRLRRQQVGQAASRLRVLRRAYQQQENSEGCTAGVSPNCKVWKRGKRHAKRQRQCLRGSSLRSLILCLPLSRKTPTPYPRETRILCLWLPVCPPQLPLPLSELRQTLHTSVVGLFPRGRQTTNEGRILPQKPYLTLNTEMLPLRTAKCLS